MFQGAVGALTNQAAGPFHPRERDKIPSLVGMRRLASAGNVAGGIQQIVHNLIGEAEVFREAGQGLSLRMRRSSQKGSYLHRGHEEAPGLPAVDPFQLVEVQSRR